MLTPKIFNCNIKDLFSLKMNNIINLFKEFLRVSSEKYFNVIYEKMYDVAIKRKIADNIYNKNI